MIYYGNVSKDGRLSNYVESDTAPVDYEGFEWVGSVEKDGTVVAYDGSLWLKGSILPQPPSLHEQAMQLSMPKATFVDIVEALTTSFAQADPTGQMQPITMETIWQWCLQKSDIMKLFLVATEVRRNDPKLDEVTNLLAPEFMGFLDMMFVYQNEIMAEIELAKAENRPINLDAYVNGA